VTQRLEVALALLYTDDGERRAFRSDVDRWTRELDLDADEVRALLRMDETSLELAASMYAKKRARHRGHPERRPSDD
jgi:hypothetical protein